MGLLDRFRKPKNRHEDIALCLVNTARKLVKSGAGGVFTAPLHIASMMSALREVHGLSPEPGSVISQSLTSHPDPDTDRASLMLNAGQAVRQHLEGSVRTDYALGLAMLSAYSQSAAHLVMQSAQSAGRSWRDLASDMQAAAAAVNAQSSASSG